MDKLVYGVAGGVALGFCLDLLLRLPPFFRWLLFPVGGAALLYWLELPGVGGCQRHGAGRHRRSVAPGSGARGRA